jgi:MerR family copper efflux transcriptional regulator
MNFLVRLNVPPDPEAAQRTALSAPMPGDDRPYITTGDAIGACESIQAPIDDITAVSVFGGTMKPKKMYKIGELMKYTRLSRQVLHNYTVMGLIEASERSEGGHRLYSEDVFDRLAKIEALKRHRTLQEVRGVLMAEDTRKREADEAVTAGKGQ